MKDLKLFYYFDLLDLDGKVDFLDSLDTSVVPKGDRKTNKILKPEKERFLSLIDGTNERRNRQQIEMQHHQYYHLNEKDSEDEDD